MKNDNTTYLVDTPDSKLVVWKDNTYFETLEKGLKKRDVEKKAIKEMLNSIDKDLVLKNKSNGAPYILHSSYSNISISHYGGHYAIFLSKEPVGVDIQTFKNSLVKGRHYFVNETEESTIELTKINLHFIWTAKEAFYKKYSGEIADLKNDVSILEIDEVEKLIRLKYQEDVFALNFAVFEAYVVTWT
jgi:phosphopantetheinyl transferase